MTTYREPGIDRPQRPARRRVVAALGALGAGALGALAPRIAGTARQGAADYCATPSRFDVPLRVPGSHGTMGRLPVGDRPVLLRAAPTGEHGALAFAARADGRDYLAPTLVARNGARARIRVVNGLDAPTIVHWHGLTLDTVNDGSGDALIAPGEAFDYAFTVRNRAGLYWYHPHPHGTTAAQAYRGLFGLFEVEDGEELALRRALGGPSVGAATPLVLHDRRRADPFRYAPSNADRVHGWYGDEVLVNFTPRPFLDVAVQRHRLRLLNASNARIFRLGFVADDGATMPFALLGTDGGLLDTPAVVRDAFLAPSERIDIAVDFGRLRQGGFALLESRAFDPMHGELHARRSGQGEAAASAHPHPRGSSGDHISGRDGGAFAIMQFRIRSAGRRDPPLPARLSTIEAAESPSGEERPLRLGFAKADFRHPFEGEQIYLFHCHNLEHEDDGMMLRVAVT
jgi:blue copper oxidase